MRLVFLLPFTLVALLSAYSQTGASVSWVKLGEDLESAEFSYNGGGRIFQPHLTLIRSRLLRYQLNVIRALDYGYSRTSAEHLCKLSKALMCVNASFFDENGNPLGLLISRGIQSQRLQHGGRTLNGIFFVTKNGPALINRDEFHEESTLEAVQAGPLLIRKGQVVEGIREKSAASRRSGVCIDHEGQVVFYLASASFVGIALQDLQKILKSSGIDCVDALNLDGGGSSQLFMSSDIPAKSSSFESLSIPGRDEVPVVLGLSLR